MEGRMRLAMELQRGVVAERGIGGALGRDEVWIDLERRGVGTWRDHRVEASSYSDQSMSPDVVANQRLAGTGLPRPLILEERGDLLVGEDGLLVEELPYRHGYVPLDLD